MLGNTVMCSTCTFWSTCPSAAHNGWCAWLAVHAALTTSRISCTWPPIDLYTGASDLQTAPFRRRVHALKARVVFLRPLLGMSCSRRCILTHRHLVQSRDRSSCPFHFSRFAAHHGQRWRACQRGGCLKLDGLATSFIRKERRAAGALRQSATQGQRAASTWNCRVPYPSNDGRVRAGCASAAQALSGRSRREKTKAARSNASMI